MSMQHELFVSAEGLVWRPGPQPDTRFSLAVAGHLGAVWRSRRMGRCPERWHWWVSRAVQLTTANGEKYWGGEGPPVAEGYREFEDEAEACVVRVLTSLLAEVSHG